MFTLGDCPPVPKKHPDRVTRKSLTQPNFPSFSHLFLQPYQRQPKKVARRSTISVFLVDAEGKVPTTYHVMDTLCTCTLIVRPGEGHAEWCDHSRTREGAATFSAELSTNDIEALASAGVSDVDWEHYQERVSVEEAVELRKFGVTGHAYSRYRDELDMDDTKKMRQLAAVGISSSRYGEWTRIGLSDVDRVARIHMAGYDAEKYLALVERCRAVLGRGLCLRVLELHPTPELTVDAVENSVEFANWVLTASEDTLAVVIRRCEEGDRPSVIMADMGG